MESYKFYKFDLSVDKLIASGHFTESNVTDAWNEVKNAFLDMGYTHPQESGYQSTSRITTVMAEEDIKELCLRLEWFSDCVDKLSLTDNLYFKDMYAVTKKYCNHKGARPEKNNIKEYRCFTYDLSKVNLTREGYSDVVGLTEIFGEGSESRGYTKLAESLKKHGFKRIQKSTWISEKELTEKEMMDTYRQICNECPWLYKCAKHIDMSVRGEHIEEDILNIAKSFTPDKETQYKLNTIKEDLFLSMNVDKKHIYCYAHDEKTDKYYRYDVSDYGIGTQAYAGIVSTSVDIMKGNFNTPRAVVVSEEEVKKATERTGNVLQEMMSKDPSFDLAFTRKNMSLFISEMMKPEREAKKERYQLSAKEKAGVVKEYNLTTVHAPAKLQKIHKNESNEKLFRAVANLSDYKCTDLKSGKNFYSIEKKQTHLCLYERVLEPIGSTYGKGLDSSKLWTDARDKENRKDGVVALRYDTYIPSSMDNTAVVKAVNRFAEEAFVKYGHVVEIFIQADRNDTSRLQATFMIADRKVENGKFAESKDNSVERDGKKYLIKFGVDSRLANFHLNNLWLSTLNAVEKEYGGQNQYIFSSRVTDFVKFAKEVEKKKGTEFSKSRLSVNGYLRKSYQDKTKSFTVHSDEGR